MVCFTKSEIRKLMFLCSSRWDYASAIIDDVADEYSPIEKACALSEGEYMTRLCAKLNSILETEAKRVEITRG